MLLDGPDLDRNRALGIAGRVVGNIRPINLKECCWVLVCLASEIFLPPASSSAARIMSRTAFVVLFGVPFVRPPVFRPAAIYSQK
jgi:hypothetical protein